MAILKKRPVIKTADDFINATPELTMAQEDISENNNDTIKESQQDVLTEKKQDANVNKASDRTDTSLSDRAKEILLINNDEEESLKRITTYIKDSLNKKVKLLSVLSGKKEYQLWNEALSDLLEKYKEKGI